MSKFIILVGLFPLNTISALPESSNNKKNFNVGLGGNMANTENQIQYSNHFQPTNNNNEQHDQRNNFQTEYRGAPVRQSESINNQIQCPTLPIVHCNCPKTKPYNFLNSPTFGFLSATLSFIIISGIIYSLYSHLYKKKKTTYLSAEAEKLKTEFISEQQNNQKITADIMKSIMANAATPE